MNITNVHIRYQDFTTVPYHPFAFGVTLGRLTVINLTGKDDFDKQAEKADDNADEEEEEEGKKKKEKEKEKEKEKKMNKKVLTPKTMLMINAPFMTLIKNHRKKILFFTFVYLQKKKICTNKKKKKMIEDSDEHSDGEHGPKEGSKQEKTDSGPTLKESSKQQELNNKTNEAGQSISKKITFQNLAVYINTAEAESPDTDRSKSRHSRNKQSRTNVLQQEDKVYWNDEHLSDAQIIAKLEVIPTQDYRPRDYDFILSPLSLDFIMYSNTQVHYYIHTYPDNPLKWKPKTECKILMHRLNITANKVQLNTIQAWLEAWKFVAARMQVCSFPPLFFFFKKKKISPFVFYCIALHCVMHFSNKNAYIFFFFELTKLEQVLLNTKKLRPMEKPKTNAKGWWRYTSQCIIDLQRTAKNERSTTMMEDMVRSKLNDNFRNRKKTYMDLYKRKMRPAQHVSWLDDLNPQEVKKLEEMEERFFVCFFELLEYYIYVYIFPIDQTLIFRSIAMAELKEALKKRETIQQEKMKEKEEKMKDSYRVTRWLNYAQAYMTQEEEFASDYQLTAEEEQRMIQQLDIFAEMAQMKLPHDYVEHRISVNLDSVWLDLFDRKLRVATLRISTKTQVQVRPTSMLIGLAIHQIELKPGFFFFFF
ncbi:ribonuclease [Reticulomyxa filosa]|uniref:Ribonuclease n=1 Tax=Reticulomyxa filosa TaxID=46433 RepID=X6N2V5_RETFI|nr:ribonuclease [Reticulomyxa filosa]|eukprot:ETO19652.1 ribonuclease [Reticulomyxa filosa]